MIGIDMEMPRRCSECPFEVLSNDWGCSLVPEEESFQCIDEQWEQRPEWCPLKQI